MAKKSKEPELTPEEKALQEKVDAMMDPKRAEAAEIEVDEDDSLTEQVEVSDPNDSKEEVVEVISVSKTRKSVSTAPELPGNESIKEDPESVDAVEEPKKSDTRKNAEPKEEAVPAKSPTEKSANLEDTKTDEAVDDIVAHESDTMLAIEDAKIDKQKRVAKEIEPAQSHKNGSGWGWLILLVLLIAAGVYLYLTEFKVLEFVISQ